MSSLQSLLQYTATSLLAANGLLHLATFFINIPGVFLVAFGLLVLSMAVAILSLMLLQLYCRIMLIPFPGLTKEMGFFDCIAEGRQRHTEAEQLIYSFISPKWSAFLGSAAGYLFLNALFCILLFNHQDSRLQAASPTSEIQATELEKHRDRLADSY